MALEQAKRMAIHLAGQNVKVGLTTAARLRVQSYISSCAALIKHIETPVTINEEHARPLFRRLLEIQKESRFLTVAALEDMECPVDIFESKARLLDLEVSKVPDCGTVSD